ncbi:hypothetical protein [Herbidospora mongoliensis]|nr:hypothetical protein [Herbidospora mongoliensis]
MSTELLMNGADAYTSLAEVATAEPETLDALPTPTVSISISLTYLLEC